jgi:hypothetical protein
MELFFLRSPKIFPWGVEPGEPTNTAETLTKKLQAGDQEFADAEETCQKGGTIDGCHYGENLARFAGFFLLGWKAPDRTPQNRRQGCGNGQKQPKEGKS